MLDGLICAALTWGGLSSPPPSSMHAAAIAGSASIASRARIPAPMPYRLREPMIDPDIVPPSVVCFGAALWAEYIRASGIRKTAWTNR